MIFDGREFAAKIEAELKIKYANLGKKLKLGIWLDVTNLAGAKYVRAKMTLATRLGVEVRLNNIVGDEDGLMVQLPHPRAKELIASIPPSKDVDGLRADSSFRPAVVRAVLEILNASLTPLLGEVLVVGSKGFVGKKLLQTLPQAIGIDKDNFDLEKIKRADVIISCTGQAGLITPEMVKEGIIAVDIGFPKGDFAPEVGTKAAFFTPVPGGVGPVTVVSLFANLIHI